MYGTVRKDTSYNNIAPWGREGSNSKNAINSRDDSNSRNASNSRDENNSRYQGHQQKANYPATDMRCIQDQIEKSKLNDNGYSYN